MHLLKLTMSMGAESQIRSRVLLPSVSALHVRVLMILDHKPLDLSWLRHQPHGQLHLEVSLGSMGHPKSRPVAGHQQVVHELQQLGITTLVLKTISWVFHSKAQALWGKLTIQDRLTLYLGDSAEGGLYALPMCLQISVMAQRHEGSGGLQAALLPVCWSAIGVRPGKVHISCQGSQTLAVEGFTSFVSTGPWQLVVHSAAGVQGLPPSRPCSEPYFLQNDAADAAGWDCTVVDSCRCLEPLHDGSRAWM